MVSDKCIVIPAAGASTRLGHSKQLVKFKGESLIRRAARTALSVCQNVVVVLGAGSDSIDREISDLPLIKTTNQNWEQGMGVSLSHGVWIAKESFSNIDGVLVHLCDLPFLSSIHLDLIFQACEANEGKIVFSVYDNFEGVPTYFPLRYFDDLLMLDGDNGAQNIFKAAEPVAKVGVKLGLNYFDVDLPEDYARLSGL